jgi:hypothetical protein
MQEFSSVPPLDTMNSNKYAAFERWLKTELRVLRAYGIFCLLFGIGWFLFRPFRSSISLDIEILIGLFSIDFGLFFYWASTKPEILRRQLLKLRRPQRLKYEVVIFTAASVVVLIYGIVRQLLGFELFLAVVFGMLFFEIGLRAWLRLGRIAKLRELATLE